MVLNEEQECVVCFQRYSRSDRVPRMLHCKHTFCVPCLDAMCMTDKAICTVSCPLCRWITCTRSSLGLSGALWVNTDIWDTIGDPQQEDEEEEPVNGCLDNIPTVQTHTQPISCVSRRSSFKSKFQKFVKTLYCACGPAGNHL